MFRLGEPAPRATSTPAASEPAPVDGDAGANEANSGLGPSTAGLFAFVLAGLRRGDFGDVFFDFGDFDTDSGASTSMCMASSACFRLAFLLADVEAQELEREWREWVE